MSQINECITLFIFNVYFNIIAPAWGGILLCTRYEKKAAVFRLFSSALPVHSIFFCSLQFTARGENYRGIVLLEKYRADVLRHFYCPKFAHEYRSGYW